MLTPERRYVVGDNSTADYNFGYVMLPKAMRSVMAYDNECQANDIGCRRYPHFSTPAHQGRSYRRSIR